MSLNLRQSYSVLTLDISREFGKTIIYDLPLFREYEYTRTALFATVSIFSRQEVKIIDFYSGEGAPEFPSAMREIFRLESMPLEEFEKQWVGTLQGNSF